MRQTDRQQHRLLGAIKRIRDVSRGVVRFFFFPDRQRPTNRSLERDIVSLCLYSRKIIEKRDRGEWSIDLELGIERPYTRKRLIGGVGGDRGEDDSDIGTEKGGDGVLLEENGEVGIRDGHSLFYFELKKK